MSAPSLLAPRRFLVVIPCRNAAEHLPRCLDSLLAQTFTDWQALVADDASTDDTEAVVRPYLEDPRIAFRSLPERGWLMGNTLDALRSLAPDPADVVAILDGDDWIRPACLERLWEAHNQGYDLAYTDQEIQGDGHSVGAPLIPAMPVRRQGWCFSQLRSFKGYLFSLLPDQTFRDASGQYFRAAGDLSLYLPMAELAGPAKIRFIPEKLYFYRIHEQCNFKVKRQEQLDNNQDIRSRPRLDQQAVHFDFVKTVRDIEKPNLKRLAGETRARYPVPFTVRIDHAIKPEERDSWRAYHGLWIEDGVFLNQKVES